MGEEGAVGGGKLDVLILQQTDIISYGSLSQMNDTFYLFFHLPHRLVMTMKMVIKFSISKYSLFDLF